jgi:DNA-binding transcriptional LysR family regulator
MKAIADNVRLNLMKTEIYPSPWDLKYFQEIASTGNLSRAAERLGVAQPTLSLSLKRLEEQLSVDLFQRGPRGLTLTEAGELLNRECNRLMAAWDSVVSETRKSETELRGRYSIGCHTAIGLYALGPVMRDLYESFPGIELQLNHGYSRIICERVVSSNLDFGLVINPVKHPDLVMTKIATDEVAFWKMPGGLDDVLLYHPDMAQTQTMLKKLKTKQFTRLLSSESLEVLAGLAGHGAGVAVLPGRVVGAIEPRLKRMTDLPSVTDELYFVYRADMRKTASARAIIERIKKIKI